MIWYTIFAATVFSGMLYLFVRDMGLSGSTMTGITIAGPVIILIVVVRILRLGTVVAADGVTRRGFLVDRHHPWSDIYEFEVIDRQAVNVAYGFQVTSRYVVNVAVGQRRRRRTLLFLDERGFTSAARFRAELDTVAALWDQGRKA